MSANIEVIGMAEAAEIVGVSKSNFSAHRSKFNGEGECPAPTAQLSSGPVWAGSDVKAMQRWAKEFAKVRVTRAPAGQSKAAMAKAAASTPKAPVKKAAPTAEAVKNTKAVLGNARKVNPAVKKAAERATVKPYKKAAVAANVRAKAKTRDAAVAEAAKGGIKAEGVAAEALGVSGDNSPEQPVAKAFGVSKKAAAALAPKKKGLFGSK